MSFGKILPTCCVLLFIALGVAGQVQTCDPQTFAVSFDGPVAVDISYSVAVVGYPSFGAEIGKVQFYAWNAATGAWVQGATFKGLQAGDRFGASVGIVSGINTTFVGAPGANGGNGAVYQFTIDSVTGEWAESITLSGAGGSFGSSLALSSDILVVGAPEANDGSGEIALYENSASSNGTWTALSTFAGSSAGSNFGYSVAVSNSGTNVAVGAPAATSGSQGAAYVFCRINTSTAFSLCLSGTANAPVDGDLFGYSVGAFGNSGGSGEQGMVVGAPGIAAVHVYLIQLGTPIYNQTVPAPSDTTGNWGQSVAVDTTFEGGVILPVVGVPQPDGASLQDPAFAANLVFENGSYRDPFVPGVFLPDANALFGSTIALSRGTALIGSTDSVTFWCTNSSS